MQLKCCGVHGSTDWAQHKLEVPQSCCPDNKCTPGNSNAYQIGCGTKIYDTLADNVKIVGIIAIVICAVEVRYLYIKPV